MIIRCMPKSHFDRAMRENHVSDSNVEDLSKVYMISIIGPGDVKQDPHYFKHQHRNVLNLEFDDCESKQKLIIFDKEKGHVEYETTPFTDLQATAIINFIQYIEDTHDTEILIHCIAGQSRSGAVGEFINEFFGYSFQELIFRNPQIKPNNLVRLILRKVHGDIINNLI